MIIYCCDSCKRPIEDKEDTYEISGGGFVCKKCFNYLESNYDADVAYDQMREAEYEKS